MAGPASGGVITLAQPVVARVVPFGAHTIQTRAAVDASGVGTCSEWLPSARNGYRAGRVAIRYVGLPRCLRCGDRVSDDLSTARATRAEMGKVALDADHDLGHPGRNAR